MEFRKDTSLDFGKQFSLFDLIAFVFRWRALFLMCLTLSLLASVAYKFYATTYYEYNVQIEAESKDHAVTKTPETTKYAMVLAFTKLKLCKIFADTFFDTLEDLSTKNNELAVMAKSGLEEFQTRFSDNKSANAISAREGLSSYLNTEWVRIFKEEVKAPKRGFLFLLSNFDNTAWKLTLRSRKGIVLPISIASAAAIQTMIKTYNEQEQEHIKKNNQNELEFLQKTLLKNQEEYSLFQKSFREERTKLQVEFYQLAMEIHDLYKKHDLKRTTHDNPFFTEGTKSENTIISLNSTIKDVNTEIMMKALAELNEKKVLDAGRVESYMKRISEGEAKRSELSVKEDFSNSNVKTNRELYNKALAVSSTLPKYEDFALAGAVLDEGNLHQQSLKTAQSTFFEFVLMTILFLLLGVLCASSLAIFLNMRGFIVKAVDQSRYSSQNDDQTSEV